MPEQDISSKSLPQSELIDRITIPVITPDGLSKRITPEGLAAAKGLRRINIKAIKARKSIRPVS